MKKLFSILLLLPSLGLAQFEWPGDIIVGGYIAATNGVRVPGYGGVVDYIWTLTNATTGEGMWKVAPGAGSGEANYLGSFGGTNAVDRFALPHSKQGVTNLMMTLSAGDGITITNEGTNLVFSSSGGGGSLSLTTNNVVVGSSANLDITDGAEVTFLATNDGGGNSFTIVLDSALTRDSEWDTSAELIAAVTDETGSGALVFGTSPTIVTPTIASFANATHDHEDAAGGGTLAAAALPAAIIYSTEIDASSEIAGIVADETGTGALVFGSNPTFDLGVLFNHLTADRAVYLDANKRLTNSAAVSAAELEFLDGVTSGIQAQIDALSAGGADYNAHADGTTNTTTIFSLVYGRVGVTNLLNNLIEGDGQIDLSMANPSNLQFSAASTVTLDAEWDTSSEIATAVGDETGSGALVFGTSPTIVTPTIASFANANHDHEDAAGGGTLAAAALPAAIVYSTEIDTSSELAGLLDNETGTGRSVFNVAPTITNLHVRLGLSLSNLTASRALFLNANFSATNSGTSAFLANSLTDETGSGLAVFGTSPTIVTPTIASFANATHTHQNAAGGGTLDLGSAVTASSATSAEMAAAISDETGSGLAVFGTSPAFTTMITLPNGADGTAVSAEGNLFWDSDDDGLAAHDGTVDVFMPFIQSETFTILEPDQVQPITDSVLLKHFNAESYPNGVTIRDIILTSGTSTSDSFNLEEWSDSAVVATIETIAFSAGTRVEDDGTLADSAIAADNYVRVDLPDTPSDLTQVSITLTWTVNSNN